MFIFASGLSAWQIADGLSEHEVAPNYAEVINAKRILEFGAWAGYSTILYIRLCKMSPYQRGDLEGVTSSGSIPDDEKNGQMRGPYVNSLF
jgi:hypothetical protein